MYIVYIRDNLYAVFVVEQTYVKSLEHHTDWVNDIVLCMDGRYREYE